MKQDEDSDLKKLGLSYGPLDNSIISYSEHQSFLNQVPYADQDSNPKRDMTPQKGQDWATVRVCTLR